MMQHSSRGLVLLFMLTVCPGVFSDDCSEEQLLRCIPFPLKQFTDHKELGFYTSKEELDKMCPQLKDGLGCIDDFTNRCMTPSRRNYFKILYAGTHSVITELCDNGGYQQEFLRHRPCMNLARSDHEECGRGHEEKLTSAGVMGLGGARGGGPGAPGGGSDPAVSAEESAKYLRTVCCSFQEYLQCSKRVVLEKCGRETANFTERFLDRMASPLMELHCKGYHVGSDKCGDFDEGSDYYSFSSCPSISLALLSLLTPLLLLRTLFPST